jgi:hypothetical protein
MDGATVARHDTKSIVFLDLQHPSMYPFLDFFGLAAPLLLCIEVQRAVSAFLLSSMSLEFAVALCQGGPAQAFY